MVVHNPVVIIYGPYQHVTKGLESEGLESESPADGLERAGYGFRIWICTYLEV